MPLYFAYGANMDREGMAKRCPASKPLGLARLARHRFVVTVDGYASVVRDPR
ncbi:MAG: gamma-glutamylcyclotransferase family protein, partial [Beijerinckiaceae bacterium]